MFELCQTNKNQVRPNFFCQIRYDQPFVNLNSQNKLLKGIQIPTSPKSCFSDHVAYASSAFNSPKNLSIYSSYSNQMIQGHSPRVRTTRIFKYRKNSECIQSLQKNKSPVKQNLRIINYGPIQLLCTRPTPQQPNCHQRPFSPRARMQFKVIDSHHIKQSKQIQTQLDETNNIKQSRFHDASQQENCRANDSYTTTGLNLNNTDYDASTINMSRVSNVNTNASKCKQEFVTYKHVNFSEKNIILEEGSYHLLQDQDKSVCSNGGRSAKSIIKEPQNNEAKPQKVPKIDQLTLAWSACLLCIFIILILIFYG